MKVALYLFASVLTQTLSIGINFVNSIQLLTSCCETIKHACNGPGKILSFEAESIKELLVEESDNYTEKKIDEKNAGHC